MTEQQIQALAKEIMEYDGGSSLKLSTEGLVKIIRRHVSATASELPSDELPMVGGKRPTIWPGDDRCYWITDGGAMTLNKSGEWIRRSGFARNDDDYRWPTREAAEQFARQCAAQQSASAPQSASQECPKCHAKSDVEAGTRCQPEGDSCPAIDLGLWPDGALAKISAPQAAAGERPSEAVRVGSDEFAALIREAARQCEIVNKAIPQPLASVCASKDGNAIGIVLDNSKSTYLDWIKGEGADIGLLRDQETDRVVGARLPLYSKSILFGGTVLPTMYFDLDSGQQLADPLSPPSPAPAAAQAREESK